MTEPIDPFAEPPKRSRPATPPPPPPPHSGFTQQAPMPDYVPQPTMPPQQPMNYAAHPQYYGQQVMTNNWMNIVSLITSLVGLCGLGSIMGIIFGHLGVNAAKRGTADNKGLGIAGLIIGYIGLAAAIGFWWLVIWTEIECQSNPSSEWCSDY